MTLMPSGSGGARSSLDDLIQLLAQSGAGGSPSPYGGSDHPAGLFGSGYRAFMAQQAPAQLAAAGAPVGDVDNPQAAAPSNIQSDSLGDFDWAPAVRAASARLGSGDPGAIQLAYNDTNCPTCHGAPPTTPQLPPPTQQTLPPLHLSDTLRNFFALPMGVDVLPPPLSGLATAGQIADALSGPQVSAFSPPRDPPAPPSGGGAARRGNSPEQCFTQNTLDNQRCNRVRSYKQRGICRESAGERMRYCINSGGEVGWPPLLTRRF